jgi:iduronate 2-sulfatase
MAGIWATTACGANTPTTSRPRGFRSLSPRRESQSGSATQSLAESVDLYPTLCELAGLPIPSGLDGRSFAATLADPQAATKDAIVHVYPRGNRLGRAVRNERYRLVEWKVIGSFRQSRRNWNFTITKRIRWKPKTSRLERPDVIKELRAFPRQATRSETANQGRRQANRLPGRPSIAAELFARKDTDKDGKLTRAEFLANQPDPDKAPARFTQFDVDKNGELSREEFVSPAKSPCGEIAELLNVRLKFNPEVSRLLLRV